MRDELLRTLREEELAGTPLLVFANKQDLPGLRRQRAERGACWCVSSVHTPAPGKPGMPELQDAKNYIAAAE